MIDWQHTYAAIWRKRKAYLRAVHQIDTIDCTRLVGIDGQITQLKRNTERFLAGLPANNALLWGSRGTGKSSLIKALLNQYKDQGLRIIQVDKDDLVDLADIVDDIREQPFRFIVFCDDLSFESGEGGYKALKSVLEGSIELPPANVLIYATSNRRHLLPEQKQDNLDTRIVEGEIHYSDAVEEKISLSDRFGIWVAFYPINMDSYLEIVDSYFSGFAGDRVALHEAARLFALGKASKSGRTAKQFYNQFVQTTPPAG